jgi:DNA-binding response OmpR family regulator
MSLFHIFLADDDADDRGLFYEAIRLTLPGAELTMASNGQELLELLVNSIVKLPRMVFLDLNMPIKNGHECLVDIRQHESLKTLPVIIYSTSDSQADIELTFESGADFYIHKPSSFSDLQNIMKKVFSLNRSEHAPTSRDGFVISAI